jgi:hypothetical protein
MSSNPGTRAARLFAAACALALSAAACGQQHHSTASTAESQSSQGTGVIEPVSASPAGDATASSGTTGSGGTGSGGTGGTRPSSPRPSRSPSPAAGPTIVSFAVSGNASCDESGPDFNSPGTVTLIWKVTGTDKVALSIDDPGFFGRYGSGSYGSYPAQDTQTLSFGCDATPGKATTHQYTLDTIGGGAHRSMTIKATATSHA